MTTNFNATTPQLKALKNVFDAYLTLDLANAEPLISKDFKFQTFPKIATLPDEGKGGHLDKYGALFALMKKIEHNIHDTVEAPGRVVVHQSLVIHTADGNELEYDSVSMYTFVEEDGELKLAEFKDFSDPEKRGKFHAWAAKALAKQAS